MPYDLLVTTLVNRVIRYPKRGLNQSLRRSQPTFILAQAFFVCCQRLRFAF